MTRFFERGIRKVLQHAPHGLADEIRKVGQSRSAGAAGGQGAGAVPPGFDPDLYLRINPDVAEAVAEQPDRAAAARRHFNRYGRAEMRRAFPDGTGISDPDSRMLTGRTRRETWRADLHALAGSGEPAAIEAVVRRHPRAGWLGAGFSLASYMAGAPALLAEIDSPEEAAFHFLEFGLEDGDHGRPDQWDRALVETLYDVTPDENEPTSNLYRRLRSTRKTGLLPLTVAEIWAGFGLPGVLMERVFDHEYYHAVSAREGDAPASFDRHVCALHFCESGRAAVRPVNAHLIFDPAFYRATYAADLGAIPVAGPLASPAQRHEETVALHDHWLRRGMATGAAPNLAEWARLELGVTVPASILDQIEVYRLAAKAAAETDPLTGKPRAKGATAGKDGKDAAQDRTGSAAKAAAAETNAADKRRAPPESAAEDAVDPEAADTRETREAAGEVRSGDRRDGTGPERPARGPGAAGPRQGRLRERAPAPLAEGANDAEVLRHMLEQPDPALAGLDLSESTSVAFLVDLADKKAIARLKGAEWLYWLALEADPDNSRARRHLSDLLQRQGRLAEAMHMRRNVPVQAETGWNALALAELDIRYGRVLPAAQSLIRANAVVQADVIMRDKQRQLARRLFDQVWSGLGPHVAAHGVDRTRAQLVATLEACTPPFSSVQRARRIRRVALVGNDDLYQCKLYRVDQKAEQLRAAGFEVKVYSPNRDLGAFMAEIDHHEAVIFFRVAAFPAVIEAITSASQHGLATFYEIDDLIFDPAQFPPPYETYANQITRAEHDAMACGVPLFEHAMRLCDYGIASTATIAEAMATRVRTGRVFEHHNALGRLHLSAIRDAEARPPRDPKAPLVLFYGSGTKAHRDDFHTILEPALARVLRKYPRKVELRLIGHFDRFRHLDRNRDPIRMIQPIWDFEEFCATVAQADINLSVLARTEVTDAKSEIKWMEAAMFGIPSVVSATRTHRETIEDGVTGMLCETPEEFEVALIRLIEDADLRRSIGRAARERVMDRYAIPAMGANLARIFDAVRPEAPPKPRLLVVNVFYPPQAIGGATRVVHDNVSMLKARYGERYEIDVICTLEGGHRPYEVNVHAMDGVRVWAISSPVGPDLDQRAQDPHMGEVFERLVQRIRPDLIHFHCIQRLTAAVVDVARLNDIPYLITAHDGWWISPNQFLLDGQDRLAFYDYREQGTGRLPPRATALWRPLAGARHVLSVSEPFAEIYRDCGVPDVITIENGVSGLPECHRTPSADGRVRLAHIGGVSRHKGYHLVRNALMANRYENLELLLVDHALQPGTVLKQVWGTTPVTIIAKIAQSEVAALYGRIDVLLAPSTWPESYGLVTREALATGAWVIASDRGAIGSDIREGVNGHVVDVATYEGLARALWQVDGAPGTYRHPPAERPAIRTAQDQIEELVALYDRILGSEAPTEAPEASAEGAAEGAAETAPEDTAGAA
ncbi:MAG: glycosyltransferase [Pseudooceanicola nanhaiensis]|uniref:glycosyltransferase n=1 Tax=Pseudooceanicola nanhaiensis TaxID=375761 RepID=UPI004059299D